MAKKTTLAAGTSPFAHLLGGAAALAGRALGKKAEDEHDNTDAEDDSDDADAEDDTPEPEEGKKGKRGKKAQDESDDADAEDEGGEPDAEDDDADEPEGKKASTDYQRGYNAANARARAIFASKAAAGRPDLAAQMAFGTRMSSSEAIGVMATASAGQPKGRGRSLDDRMGNRTDARPGAGGGKPSGKASLADKLAGAKTKLGRA